MFGRGKDSGNARRGDDLQNVSWEADIVLNERKSRTTAWRIASAACLLAVIQGVGISLMLPLKTVVPTVVMVDKLTGEGQVVAPAQEFVATNTLSDKHWVQNWVISRERYVYRFIQYDYDNVRRMAGDQAWANYTPLFEGPESLDVRLKDNVEIIPSVLSITLTGNGMATVRYELRTRDYRSTAPAVVTRRIATIRYEYKARDLVLEKEAIANPLGFTVTAYQTDPEMGGDGKGNLQ